jgi:hypothetical protein
MIASVHRTAINSDEANVVDRALRLFVEGPNPRWFVYPSLHLYAVALAEGLLFCVRWVLCLSSSPQAFADWYFADPRWILVTARLWSVAAGAATLWMVYRLGVRLAMPSVGLWAAAFLAVSPLHIYYSAIAKPDAVMVLAMVGAGLTAARYVQERQTGLPWAPAILGGLGATVKYPGGAAWMAAPVAMLFAPSLLRRGVRAWISAVGALTAAGAVIFLAGTPFALVEPGLLYRDLAMHRQVAAQGMPGMEGVSAWRLYLGSAVPDALSLPILALAIWGLAELLRRDWKTAIAALTPTVAYAVPTFSATLAQVGFVLPLLPVLCVCAAVGLDACRAVLPNGLRRRLLVGGVAIICVASPLAQATCFQIRAQRPTAQEQAAGWIREHLPPGARIFGASTGLTMILPLTPDRLTELVADAMRNRPDGGARLRYLQRMTPSGAGYYLYDMEGYEPTSRTGEPRVREYDPDWIAARGFEYVVDSEVKMRMFLASPDRYPLPFQFQRWVREHGELIFTTHPGSRGLLDWQENPYRVRALEPRCGFAGGELRIYRIRAVALADLPTTAPSAGRGGR